MYKAHIIPALSAPDLQCIRACLLYTSPSPRDSCKSGADRAGIMCALYMLIYKKEHPHIAKKQLSWKYLHVKWAKPGVLDSFVEEYSKQYKQNKMKFIDWVKEKYNSEKLESNFRSVWWINRLLDDFLKRE